MTNPPHDLFSDPLRHEDEPPPVVAKLGWRYHHIGIPTTIQREGERYLPAFKVHVSGFDRSPCGIEWIRFQPDSPLPELIRTQPHIAFEADDLDGAIEGQEVIYPPGSPPTESARR